MEPIGCIHFSSEHGSYEYPGFVDCELDMDLTECTPDCPGFEAVLDEATARNI